MRSPSRVRDLWEVGLSRGDPQRLSSSFVMGGDSWIPSRRRDPVVLDRRVALGVQASGCASRDLVDSVSLDRVSYQIATFDVARSHPVPRRSSALGPPPPWEAAVHRTCGLGSADRIRDFRFDTLESVRLLNRSSNHSRWLVRVALSSVIRLRWVVRLPLLSRRICALVAVA